MAATNVTGNSGVEDIWAERRERIRSATRRRIDLVVDVEGRDEPVAGTLRDLSRNGAGINLPTPVEIGRCVHFTLVAGQQILRTTCRVANCRLDPTGGYVVGMELLAADRLGACTKPTFDVDVDVGEVDALKKRLGEGVG